MSYRSREPLDCKTRKTLIRMKEEMLDFGGFILNDLLLKCTYDKEVEGLIMRLVDMVNITADEIEDILKRR